VKSSEIRQKFSEYFQRNGHLKMPSSSLVPENDPTLLFANAGMNQFKNYFTGQAKPKSKKAITIQKCVRAGGKHNDLENIGFTARHHTFFEMLGNFSFGDYFKQEAIEFAWKFLTQELSIPSSKLFITVHHSDNEAYDIWNKHIGITPDKIFKKGDKDNFWEMGEFGPCGPCSEIFFDHGEQYATPNIAITDGDILQDEQRYVEIWNLVFMQYEKTLNGTLNLPNPSIDTGAGLERLAAVMQNKYWNYDTDCFSEIISSIEEITNKKYNNSKYVNSMRVVADHIRSSVMLITDGIIPSNEGRGYVLRRIIRRAVRHLRELDAPASSLWKIANSVLESLGIEYPHNKSNLKLAQKFLKLEEEKFLETLDQGLKFLNTEIKNLAPGQIFPGDKAFKLYDTFGFPVDLTEIILDERNYKLDKKAFQTEMDQSKVRSKKTWKSSTQIDQSEYFSLLEQKGPTKFIGHVEESSKSSLIHLLSFNDQQDILFFDKTPFYGESGGQVGDVGIIKDSSSTLKISVLDVIKPIPQLHGHIVCKGHNLTLNSTYELVVDSSKRSLVSRNHSATHLLQAALIATLGDHVKQAGSLVTASKLRFDFTHPNSLSREELNSVEKLINDQIRRNLDVVATNMSKDDAIKSGALAIFGEKYDEKVRVLKMGDFSTELCGGIHVRNTSEISIFKITSESSLSSGIRRIEAITSSGAFDYLSECASTINKLQEKLNSSTNVLERVSSLQSDLKKSRKEIQELKDQIQTLKSNNLFTNSIKINNDHTFYDIPVEGNVDMRKLSDDFASKFPLSTGLIYCLRGDKVQFLLRTDKKIKQLDMGKILKENISILQGRGGGKPHMAQGSGSSDQFQNFKDVLINLIKRSYNEA
jgi:alanyl-tRNA synthetase